MVLPKDVALEEQMMYGRGAMTEQELDEKYPNRPHNHAKTLPFADLPRTLFNPLNEARQKASKPVIARGKVGPDGPHRTNKHEARRQIIDRFISRWRSQVGNDIYPVIRLIIPDKDRDRAMYGLKESTLGRLLVKVMKIDKNSEDGFNLLHWKLPGLKASSAMAGDFAGRCFEVISKRPMRIEPGDLTIAEVNEMLDRLSVAQKEENQMPIMEEFYKRMNAEEMLWLIRMILRQIKIGASEKTILDVWHKDAENLFNISSSLRRVCWELYDPEVRLEGDDRGITLMQCFQPQLAAFQMRTMEQMVKRMKLVEGEDTFWIEEKLDGERMQLHMIEDESHPGGKRFCFWSRKAKDYTYLYGDGFEDPNSALTRHLRDAFDDRVRNIILDGEMITWDFKTDAMVPFGHLKTAALSEQANPFSDGMRPFFKVFDCLYLNDRDLTRYELRERYKALQSSVHNVHRRLEVHDHTEARQASEIEPKLREVVAESTEGLVLKNPRSAYKLNERNDDWIKVKPEYMTEFGEALDCIVIGGYYGSGHRGGNLSSFMCGLRVSEGSADSNKNPQKCLSFFKVGGGFAASDYATIRHRLEGKWQKWDRLKPPSDWIVLGGGERLQYERPDVWIKPEDSIVFEVKAASVNTTDQFGTGFTLRFPRFKRVRDDKNWLSALSISDFLALKTTAEEQRTTKAFKIDVERRNRREPRRKRAMVVVGANESTDRPYAGPATKVFAGMSFLVMSEALKPLKKSKTEIEQLIKANGGSVVASDRDPKTVLISDRNVVKAASLVKKGDRNIVRPRWVYDCVEQGERNSEQGALLLPFEPRHLFFCRPQDELGVHTTVDEFGDSFARDLDVAELDSLLRDMSSVKPESSAEPIEVLADCGLETRDMPALYLGGLSIFVADKNERISRLVRAAGGSVNIDADVPELTHIAISPSNKDLFKFKRLSAHKYRPARLVQPEWVEACWQAKTRLDEEQYSPIQAMPA